VVGPEDAAIILSDDLFAAGFVDAEGQTLAAIKIVTLPASGILKLDGVAVTAGQVISVAELAADKLTYQGNLNSTRATRTSTDPTSSAGTAAMATSSPLPRCSPTSPSTTSTTALHSKPV